MIVKNYPYRASARAIFELLKDGAYHNTKGKPDKPPFNEFIKTSNEELRLFATNDDGSLNIKLARRYSLKKRRVLLDQFMALKLLGFAETKGKTNASVYGLTEDGLNMLQGLAIIEEAKSRGETFRTIWQTLFPDKVKPDIEESEEDFEQE